MTILPVASVREVRACARRLALRHPRRLLGALVLHIMAAISGLVSPWLLGKLVQQVVDGGTGIDRVAVLICTFVILQTALLQWATYTSAALGERVLAELRETFLADMLGLPLSTLERAGTGDLVSRTSLDVASLSSAVRSAVPDLLTSMTAIIVAVGGLLVLNPLVAFPGLIAVPLLWAAARWYFARARDGYLREKAAWAEMTEGLSETVDGAATIEALRISGRRVARGNRDIDRTFAAERYTLWLRTVYLPIVDTAYMVPVAATLLIGGLFSTKGMVSLADVTAASLYMQQLVGPIDLLLARLQDLQMGSASLARLLGAGSASRARPKAGAHVSAVPAPAHQDIELKDVSYAYRPGHPVLHGIDLRIRHGERLAVVGPSGAGKTTLGRLLAGVEEPLTGSVTIGDVPIGGLPLELLRKEVALVTQEHHVFSGTLRENLALARPDADDGELRRALDAVDAWSWASELGLDCPVGGGAVELSPGQAQQLSLARIVLADPHTLVLDEATSLLAPRAARQLERSLTAVLKGRTVIAIAHRLHTAHDADRVLVLDAGRATELGTHDDLIRLDGTYAALWRSWQGGLDTVRVDHIGSRPPV